MSLSLSRKVLWGITAVASIAFAWSQFGERDQTSSAGVGSVPSFQADFRLPDQRGVERADEEFVGRWMLIFFGFSNCPDVCPTTLSEVAAVMDGLGRRAADVQPIFVSIDPERDNPSALDEYVSSFDTNIIGLTGTSEQIERTARNFHIYYETIDDPSAPDGYAMGHSSQLFLFGPDGTFVKAFDYGTPAEAILADLTERMS